MHNLTGLPGPDANLHCQLPCCSAALLLPATQPSPVANTEKLPKTIVHPAN
jgi:hypothetical protein